MLHHVERWPLLEQPAGKNASPLFVRLFHLNLHKAAGEMFLLPWRGLLARLEPEHDLAKPRRFSGLQRNVTRHAIALVQQPKHRHALRHGRCPLRPCQIFRRGDGNDVNPRLRRVERGIAERLDGRFRRGLCAAEQRRAEP